LRLCFLADALHGKALDERITYRRTT